MLVVKTDGACDIFDEVGFHAVGIGDIRAQTYLRSYPDFRYKSLAEVCYRLQAAKFMAENSPFVGPRQTITTVYHFDRRISYNHGAAASREYFDAEMSRAIPDETLAAIVASLSAGPGQF